MAAEGLLRYEQAMIGTAQIHLARLAVTLLMSLALASLPFAHRANSAADEAALAGFVLAGGTLADICGGSADHVGTVTSCEACRVTAAMLLPPLEGKLDITASPRPVALLAVVPWRIHTHSVRFRPPVRGPPIN